MNVVLGLGGNLGNRETQLWKAVGALRPHLEDLALSPFYESTPVGVLDQPAFLNMAVAGTYNGTASDLLALAKRIEADLGRQARARFGPREIDIDVLLIDGAVIDTETLTVPHLRLRERLFALMPATDLWPDRPVIGTGRTVRELLELHPDYAKRAEHCRLHLPACTRDALTADWIRHAVEHMGAFVFKNALDPELVLDLIATSRDLLRLPMADKLRFAKAQYQGGYTPPGVERVARHGTDNQREFWDIPPHGRRCSFPASHQRLYGLTRRTYDDLASLAHVCTRAIDTAYGTTVTADANGGEHMLRMSRYFSQGRPDTVLFPEHFDFGLLTLFCGGTAPGLEGRFADTWHPMAATDTPGDVLVGTANTLKVYLPHIRAFHHRVTDANTQPEERLSVSLFTEPRLTATLPNGQNAGERLRKALARIRPE